jgi:hypothetical protein
MLKTKIGEDFCEQSTHTNIGPLKKNNDDCFTIATAPHDLLHHHNIPLHLMTCFNITTNLCTS